MIMARKIPQRGYTGRNGCAMFGAGVNSELNILKCAISSAWQKIFKKVCASKQACILGLCRTVAAFEDAAQHVSD